MIRLTDEEMVKVQEEASKTLSPYGISVAKAQLKKVVEEALKPNCYCYGEFAQITLSIKDWQSLLEEVK